MGPAGGRGVAALLVPLGAGSRLRATGARASAGALPAGRRVESLQRARNTEAQRRRSRLAFSGLHVRLEAEATLCFLLPLGRAPVVGQTVFQRRVFQSP